MPFTFSHPAAVVPLARCGLPFSALVVGSMAPDFPYFLLLSTRHQFGHTLPGLFLFCVPVGLVTLWLWHRVLEQPLKSLLSLHLQPDSSVEPFSYWPREKLTLIVVALLIGAATHVVWDSFTHANGHAVQHWSPLRAPLFITDNGTFYLFKALQHGSSLVGALVLIRLLYRQVKGAPVLSSSVDKTNSRLILPMMVVAFIGAVCFVVAKNSFASAQTLARDFILATVSILFIELIAWSAFWHWIQRR